MSSLISELDEESLRVSICAGMTSYFTRVPPTMLCLLSAIGFK